MSNENSEYIRFLEESVTNEDAGVVDDTYVGMQSANVKWDGNGSVPEISKDEKLNLVVDKILKREPKEDGTEQHVDLNSEKDPAGIDDGTHVKEQADGEEDEKKEDGDEGKEEDEEGVEEGDCPECDKKIKEIFAELGLSPLELMEGGIGEVSIADALLEGVNMNTHEKTVDFTPYETKILEQFIAEMGMSEDSDDEFADDATEDKEDKEEDEDEDDDEEL
jgi:hypothetical protein